MMRHVLPWLALLLAVASLLFFYEGVTFLSAQDYVSALCATFVGFALLRTGLELVRFSMRRGGGS